MSPCYRAGLTAALLLLSVNALSAAEAAQTPATQLGSTADWGLSGTTPQTGSTAHTSGHAFATDRSVRVVIDKSTQRMTVLIDDAETYVWKVSTGLPSYATPSGTYAAKSMNEMWYSREWDDAPMPHSVFFTKRGHAIHGTDQIGRLGNPASHGCVRLAPNNAAVLFDLVRDVGLDNTEVVLTGLTPGGEGSAVAQSKPRKQKNQRVQSTVERNELGTPRFLGRRGWKRNRSAQSGRAFGLGPRPFYRHY